MAVCLTNEERQTSQPLYEGVLHRFDTVPPGRAETITAILHATVQSITKHTIGERRDLTVVCEVVVAVNF